VSEPTRYPLAWPAHKPRTKWQDRKAGDFVHAGKKATMAGALDRLETEIDRLGGVYPLLSSNYELKMDGTPRLDRAAPDDPGVCVYFHIKGEPYAMACDTYTAAAQNIMAIANHIEATRRIARYGVATAAEALQAFQALPPPAGVKPARPWWEVFGVMRQTADKDMISALYRAKAKTAATDEGALQELNLARDAALKEIRA
jgi:hypothetical protein